MTKPQIVLSLIGIIVVIAGAYFATYLLASRSAKTQMGRAVRVLDRFSFSKEKMICAIEVLDKVYLVAFAGEGVTLLDTLDAEDYRVARDALPQPVFGAGQAGVAAADFAHRFAGNMRDMLRQKISRAPKSAAVPPFEETVEPSPDLDPSGSENFAEALRVAREADDLDEVYRRMQASRAKAERMKESPPEGGETP